MKTLLLDVALAMVPYHINRKADNIEGIKCEEQQDVYGGYSVYILSPLHFSSSQFFFPFSLLSLLPSSSFSLIRLLHDI